MEKSTINDLLNLIYDILESTGYELDEGQSETVKLAETISD